MPAFFLIESWGRDPEKRRAAAFKFFVWATMGGSVGMLLLFQFFYLATNCRWHPDARPDHAWPTWTGP